jgi:hypothetical protein
VGKWFEFMPGVVVVEPKGKMDSAKVDAGIKKMWDILAEAQRKLDAQGELNHDGLGNHGINLHSNHIRFLAHDGVGANELQTPEAFQ